MGLKDIFSKKDSNNKGNFKDLEKLIKKSKEVVLEYDFTIDIKEHSKYHKGIKIKKNNLIIEGNGHYIDAKKMSRIFWIESKKITFKNIEFKNGFCETGGAFLIDQKSSINFENCKFKNNKAQIGGAIYAHDQSKIKFNNCIFEFNSSDTYGGVFVNENKCESIMESCNFLNNKANRGGCIFNVLSILNIENTNFDNNQSIEYAGTIYNYLKPEEHIDRTKMKFDDIINEIEGGNPCLTISSSNFNNNHAQQGGAIVNLDTTSTFNQCNFKDNTAGGAGGAVFSNNSKLKMFSSNFQNNNAEDGGAVKIDNKSMLHSEKCLFENNKAIGKIGGGAIYCEQSSLHFKENTFKNNNSNNGGAIYNIHHSNSYFNSCTFESNWADNNGGAIGNYDSNFNLNDCIFKSNNSKEAYGGAIHNYEGDISIGECEFANNLSNIDGGAISNIGSDDKQSLLYLKNSTFEKCIALNGPAIANYKSYANIQYSTFEKNKGERGGALFNDQTSEMKIEESAFDNNSADLGGAIDNWNKLTILNCSFEDNESLKYSAGTICHGKGILIIDNTRFENNTSKLAASVLYSLNGNVEIRSSSIENNESSCGVILNQLSFLRIENCHFENNDGGNSCILNGGDLTLTSNIFCDENEVILANKGEVNINSCDIEEDSRILNCGNIDILNEDGFTNSIIEKIDCTEFDNSYNIKEDELIKKD